tara:strand:+ start:140 stop:520 length:381 start_codon:yes stop_codon:yes gene_type:complete
MIEVMEIQERFGRACPPEERPLGFMTKDERKRVESLRGTRAIRGVVLGKFGLSKVLSADELAEIFQRSGAVTSIEEGRELLPLLDDKVISYGSGRRSTRNVGLYFSKVENAVGKKAYRVSFINFTG